MARSTRSRSSIRRLLVSLSALVASACVGAVGCSDNEQRSDGAGSMSVEARLQTGGEVMLAHVYYKDEADLRRLVETLDVLEDVDRKAGWVAIQMDDPDQYHALVMDGHRVDIVEWLPVGPRRSVLPQASGIPGFACYRTVEETHAAMNRIASSFPNLAAVASIGQSWNKGHGRAGFDLLVLKLTNRSIAGPKPIFFLMGGIHAREYTTAETAMRFAEQMANGYGTDPDATWLLDHYELHVVPQTNPDGRKLAEQGYSQRKNTNDSNGGGCSNPPRASNQFGTDLNRNSSFKYATGGSSTNPCDLTYRGRTAISEPETRSLQTYIASIFPDQRGPGLDDPAPSDATGLLVTLHSFAEQVLYPWTFADRATPNEAQLATLGRKFGFLNGYAACRTADPSCSYADSGQTDDWSYGELGVASYTFEMGTAFFESCSTFESTVAPRNLAALRYAFKAARRPYQTPSGPESLRVTVSPASVTAGTRVTLTASADDTRYDSHGHGTEPTQNIAAARYSVDKPSWGTGAATVPMSAADGAFNAKQETVTATIDTTGWSVGRHVILVESRDAANNWGVPGAVFLDIR